MQMRISDRCSLSLFLYKIIFFKDYFLLNIVLQEYFKCKINAL